MVEKLGAGQVTLSDDQTGANYGRAALNLLVQLVPLINREGPARKESFRPVTLSGLSADIVKLWSSSLLAMQT